MKVMVVRWCGSGGECDGGYDGGGGGDTSSGGVRQRWW